MGAMTHCGSTGYLAGKHTAPAARPLPYSLEELEQITKLIRTLDDHQAEEGTRLLGPARFVIYGEGAARTVTVDHAGEDGWHLLAG